MFWLQKIVASVLLVNSSYRFLGLHTLIHKLPCGRHPRGKGLKATSSHQPPTAGPEARSPRALKEPSCQPPRMSLGAGLSLVEPSDNFLASVDNLIATLCER